MLPCAMENQWIIETWGTSTQKSPFFHHCYYSSIITGGGALLDGGWIQQGQQFLSCAASTAVQQISVRKEAPRQQFTLETISPNAARALLATLWSLLHTTPLQLESDCLWSLALHFPTISHISHLTACNPAKTKSFQMSLFCPSASYLSAFPASSALFYVIIIIKALLKLHPAQGHSTELNPAQFYKHISAFTFIWFIYPVYYHRPIQSVQAGIQTHVHLNDAYKHSSRDIRTAHSFNIWPSLQVRKLTVINFYTLTSAWPQLFFFVTGNQRNWNSITNSTEEAWKRNLCISYPKPVGPHFKTGLWVDSSFISFWTHRNPSKTPTNHIRQLCQANLANRIPYGELQGIAKH